MFLTISSLLTYNSLCLIIPELGLQLVPPFIIFVSIRLNILLTKEKFAARANRMTIPLLKIMCDLFDVDRSHPGRPSALDKEGIVGRLLDFMVAPDITLTNAGKTKAKKRGRPSISRSPKAKRSKKSEEIEVEVEYIEDEEEEEEEEDAPKGAEGKKMPSKKELQKFVRAYVTCFSMEKTTTKHLIQTASDKFDVDVASKRKDILELLTAEMPSE